MIPLLVLHLWLLPSFCNIEPFHPRPTADGQYMIVRKHDWMRPQADECFVYRRNVGSVCWFAADGGAILGSDLLFDPHLPARIATVLARHKQHLRRVRDQPTTADSARIAKPTHYKTYGKT